LIAAAAPACAARWRAWASRSSRSRRIASARRMLSASTCRPWATCSALRGSAASMARPPAQGASL
jgi:hypothetical protein